MKFIFENIQGGCCFAFKMEELDETTGEASFISRFGTPTEPEQPWFDQNCGETVITFMLYRMTKNSNIIIIVSSFGNLHRKIYIFRNQDMFVSTTM